jgi:uncharacterized protein YkwD
MKKYIFLALGFVLLSCVINAVLFGYVDKYWHPDRHGKPPAASPYERPFLTSYYYADQCSTTGNYCRKALLQIINQDRATNGRQPLLLDSHQTYGDTQCPGSQGHSRAMARAGYIFHTDTNYIKESFPNDICGWPTLRHVTKGLSRMAFHAPFLAGVVTFTSAAENVGASSGPKWAALQIIHQLMINEGPNGGHYQNLMSYTSTHIGIGIRRGSDGNLYLTEDFTG